ncbi:hypothetical protein LCGC14_2960450 [marine sediment metagenome]|uniref:Uncharacterized protein n=1 Tax=marine sediment metagenome TaxID=412755 RepID=A0A0F8ZK60_9ZZZZ
MKINVTRIQSLYGTCYGVQLGKHSYEQSLDGTLWYTKPISRGPFVPLWVELWLGLIVLTARWRGIVENVPNPIAKHEVWLAKRMLASGQILSPDLTVRAAAKIAEG